MIHGNITVGENAISQGDGISIEQTTEFTLESISDSEFLLFDLK